MKAPDLSGPAATPARGLPLRSPATLRGTVLVPSDKSIGHRALICSALATGTTTVTLREPGVDVLSTVNALRSLGASIEEAAEPQDELVQVRVAGLGDKAGVGRLGPGEADCGNSGTTMRLLAGALASGTGPTSLTGDASLSRRPMERVAKPLRAMGADVRTIDGHAPVWVHGARPLRALEHDVPVASAQVLAAIAFAALAADGRTTVRLPGLSRDHTERMLSFLGAEIRREEAAGGASVTTIDGPASLAARSLDVPGDISSAAAWVVAGTLHPAAEVRLRGVGLNPTRTALLEVLRRMGADIEAISGAAADTDDAAEPVGELVVRTAGNLRAVSVGPDEVPALIDELPLLAVAMAAAEGTSEVRSAAELRLKESDRIAAISGALSAAGARVEELPDGWRISRGRPLDASVQTHGDHRIAMALAVAAWSGVARSVVLDDPQCVAISYPSFWRHAAALGALP